ncbi:calcineurin-like phosphoesterase family protein 3, partial [Achromobacter marplatensis]
MGDIVDGWQLRKHWHWPRAHNDVIQRILRKARIVSVRKLVNTLSATP